MRVGAVTNVGCIRRANEDAYHVDPSLLVVADGMGGHAAGEVASAMAVRTLATWPQWDDPVRNLRASLEYANQLIVRDAEANPQLAGMGTTVTAAYVKKGLLHFAHVGDSRLYLYRNAELRQVTRDHSIVGELQRFGGLTENEARRHPQRNVLTRVLGVPGAPGLDLGTIELFAGDRILLSTDGLHGYLLDREIARVLALHTDPQLIAGELVAAANAKGGPDNITVIVANIIEEDVA